MAATVSSSEPRFWVTASPRGKRSGFAVLSDGSGGRITFTVVPKPWSTQVGAVREYAHVPGSTTHIVAHETELVALSTTASAIGALAMSLAEISRDQADLLGLGTARADLVAANAPTSDPFRDLFDLMLMAERGRLTTSPLGFEGAFAPSLLRLITQERLLQIVESLIFRARPRYAERTETLQMPRGRLRENSLLFSLATGTPRVESIFDELTIDTRLLQVVASALRVVASDRLPRKITVLRPGLQARAVHLLRYMTGVSLIDRERALLTAERLWLSPLDRIWKPAIDAALPVLRDRAILPDSGAERTEAFLVQVSTEKFWEQCLELVLASAFQAVAVSRDGRPGEGVAVPAPWMLRTLDGHPSSTFATTSSPDFMFRSAHRVVVADAKYKVAGGATPSSQDGYQIFAYSHLATLGEHPSNLAILIYPVPAGHQPDQIELERLRDRGYALWQVRLPFPTRADIQSQSNWSAHIARMAGTIREFSADWVVRHLEG